MTIKILIEVTVVLSIILNYNTESSKIQNHTNKNYSNKKIFFLHFLEIWNNNYQSNQQSIQKQCYQGVIS
jgi:hypothetical protein